MSINNTFTANVLERCDKETEETIALESQDFLKQPIRFLQEQQGQFVYAQSEAFAQLRIDAVVLEFDEMFQVYTALFGLQLKKKVSETLKAYMRDHLKGMLGSSSAMFNGDEGLWEVNIALDAIDGFTGEETFEQAYELFMQFVSGLLAEIAEG